MDGGMETMVIDATDGRVLGTDRSRPATTGASSGAGPLTTAPASPTPPQTPGFAGTGAIAGLLGAAVRLRRAGRSGVNRARPKP